MSAKTRSLKLPKCKQCKGKRTMPAKSYASEQFFLKDEFCSRKCCEKAHGISHKTGGCSTYYKEGYGEEKVA